MNRTGILFCVGGAALIVISAHTHGWRVGDLSGIAEFGVGLLSMSVCVGERACETVSLGRAGGAGMPVFAQAYLTISLVAYGFGLVAAGLLLAAAWYVPRAGVTRPARWAAFGTGAYLLGALMTAAAWGGLASALGWSFYVAVAGSLAGIVGAGYLIIPSDDYGETDLAAVLASVDTPGHANGPVSDYGPSPRRPGELAQKPVASPRRPERDAIRYSLDQEAGASSVDTAANMLRLVAREVELGEEGLVVHGDGPTRRVPWGDIEAVHARTLPVDAPFEGRALLDLVVAGERPVRILPTTRVNYAWLPGGVGATSVESFRKLAQFAVERCELTASAELRPFLAGAKPVRFNSVGELRRYDARYVVRSGD